MPKKDRPPTAEELAASLDRLETIMEQQVADTQEMKRDTQEMKKDTQEMKRDTQEMKKDARKLDRKLAIQEHRNAEQWGQLAEYLAKSGLIDTVNRHRDINVIELLTNVEVSYGDHRGEIDIIAVGERDIVVVETKTTLTISETNRFKRKYLQNFSLWKARSSLVTLPDCADRRIFGCVTYLKAKDNAEEHALRLGLITVRTLGRSSKLINPDAPLTDYHPARFSL